MHERPKISTRLVGMKETSYGALIREARKAKGWTQAELAARMQTSPSTISNLEREQHPPTVPEEVNDLVITLGISPETLLSRMGVRINPPPVGKLDPELIRALGLLTQSETEVVQTIVRGLLAQRPHEPASARPRPGSR